MPQEFDKHDVRRYVDIFLDKYVFGTTPKISELEKELKLLIKEISVKTFKILQIFSVLLLILLLQSLKGFSGFLVFILLISIVGILVLFVWSVKNSSKTKKAKKQLQNALKSYKTKDIVKTMDLLLEAYKVLRLRKLWNLIIGLAQEQKPTPEQQAIIVEFEFEKDQDIYKNDEKLADIMQQILNVGNYITKHGEVISNSWKKIKELKVQLQATSDTRLIAEYNSLIKRYDDIVALEQSKIEFYSKAKNELLMLKENHLVTQKLMKEKEELKNLEDKILEKSIQEQYNVDMSVNDFIFYENAYLEALKEYSEPISSTGNQNLFEEISQNFKDKTKLL